MRKFILWLTTIAVLSIISASCTNTNINHPELQAAKEMIDQNPDSALILLNEIKPYQLINEDQRMYRRLLIIEATDKAYLSPKDDKEITQVLNYFIGKDRLKNIHPEVYYYAGRTYSELREDDKALEFFNKALRELRLHPNIELENCIHAQLGTLYSTHGLRKHYLREFQMHLRLTDSVYNKANDNNHLRERIGAHMTLAAAYRQARLVDSSLYLYSQLKPQVERLNDSVITTIYYTQLALAYLHGNDYVKADSILRLAPKAANRASLPSVESIFNLFAVRRDGGKVNEKTTEGLLSNPNLEIQYHAALTLAKLAQERKDGERLLKYAQKIFEIDEKFQKEYNENALAEMEKILDQTQLENDNLMLTLSNQKKEIWLIISIFSIVLLIAVIIIYHKHASQKQIQNKLEVEKLKNENSRHIKELEEEIADLNTVYEQTRRAAEEKQIELQRQIDLQNDIEQKRRKGEQLEAELRLAKIREVIIDKLTTPKEKVTQSDLANLRKAISLRYPGFFETLAKMKIPNDNLTDAMFIKLQLPHKLVANHFCKTASAITNSRRRLFDKYCTDMPFESWKDFIISLGNKSDFP